MNDGRRGPSHGSGNYSPRGRGPRRVCALAIAAVTFTITARARDARAQSEVAGKWYDEVRGIIEDLAKQKLAEGLSSYLAQKQHAACYYLRGSLGRMQSGYWGGVPASLREDGLELLGDWIYYVVTHADTAGLAESVKNFIDDANSRYSFAATTADVAAAQRPCSSQWWDKRGSVGVSLVYTACRAKEPTQARERMGCGVAQATMAYLRRDTESMKRHISELTAWAINEVVSNSASSLPAATVKEIGNQLSSWIDDATSLKEMLRDVSSLLSNDLDNILRAMNGTCPAPSAILQQAGTPTPKDVGCLLLAMKQDLDLRDGNVLKVSIAGGAPEPMYQLRYDVSRIIKDLTAAGQPPPTTVGACGGSVAGVKVDLLVLGTVAATLHAKADGALCVGEPSAQAVVELVNAKLRSTFSKSWDLERLTSILAFANAAPEQLPNVVDYLRNIEQLLRKIDRNRGTASQNWSLVLAIDVLRDALKHLARRFSAVPLAEELLSHLGPHEIETLTAWADRRDYRDIAMMVFEVFEKKAVDDNLEVAEVRLLAKFVSFVLDSSDTVNADGLSTAAFRSAAMDYLSSIDKGFPIPASTAKYKLQGSLIPSAALRYSWNPDYRSAATEEGFRRIVTVDWPRVNVAVSRYAGFQFSALDVVGPLTENALRADYPTTDNDWEILWDFLRPRFNAYLMVPQITRNLAIGASASWRPLEVQYPTGTPDTRLYCGPGCETWNAGTAEVDLAVLVAF